MTPENQLHNPGGAVEFRKAAGTLVIELSGKWRLDESAPSSAEVQRRMESESGIRQISFDSRKLEGWDSSLLTYLIGVDNVAHKKNASVDSAGLPEGIQRLLKLASAVPERKGAQRHEEEKDFLYKVGEDFAAFVRSAGEMVTFVGAAFLTLLKYFRGKARYRRSDLFLTIQECGPQALPIVTLISILVGLILAFVGAVQLEQFGAEIYVANLVGLGMAREMGAMMAAIIMAGRTGAAFAAQLGTMQVNEEIDALTAMGISSMEFLVLPRMLALALMMPLLCLYANLMGILGGALVGWGMLDIPMTQYYLQTQGGVSLMDFSVGLIKSAVFGVLVAIAGCLRGIQCKRSSAAVGVAATSAVVTGIVAIIVSDSFFTILFNALGI